MSNTAAVKPTEEQKKCAQDVFDRILNADFISSEEGIADMMKEFQKEYKQCFINTEQDIAKEQQEQQPKEDSTSSTE